MNDPTRVGWKGYNPSPKSYALSGKIMLSAIVILFTVVLLILCLHVYARCFLLRRRRNYLRSHRSGLHFHQSQTSASADVRGLEASVLRSLPVFVFSPKTHPDPIECAVCLSEFEENETGRLLPKCNHRFHIDCIDMWFHSHSTCPLCRAPVQSPPSVPPPPASTDGHIEVVVENPDVGPSSGLCSSCRDAEETSTSSSSSISDSGSCSECSTSGTSMVNSGSFRKKGMGIEVPTRRNEEDLEIAIVSPIGLGLNLKSPGSRILSLKRILSREKRAVAGASALESDLERGHEPLSQSDS